jgi:hypothetical protein
MFDLFEINSDINNWKIFSEGCYVRGRLEIVPSGLRKKVINCLSLLRQPVQKFFHKGVVNHKMI